MEVLVADKTPFVKPKKVYYFGKLQHGCPYFYPRNFSDTIIKFKKLELTPQEELDKLPNTFYKETKKFKNLPMVRRSKDWIIKLFNSYYWIEIGWPLRILKTNLGWKDKFDSPRFEWPPAFHICFFNLQFCIWWTAPDGDNDQYYEQYLWYYIYCKEDIVKAKETWPWQDYKTKQSSWNDNYIKS